MVESQHSGKRIAQFANEHYRGRRDLCSSEICSTQEIRSAKPGRHWIASHIGDLQPVDEDLAAVKIGNHPAYPRKREQTFAP